MHAQLLADYITFEQLATELNKSPRTLERWRRERRLPPHVKIGGQRLFHLETVAHWLRSLEQTDAPLPQGRGRGRALRRSAARWRICAHPGCNAQVDPKTGRPGPKPKYCPGHTTSKLARRGSGHGR